MALTQGHVNAINQVGRQRQGTVGDTIIEGLISWLPPSVRPHAGEALRLAIRNPDTMRAVRDTMTNLYRESGINEYEWRNQLTNAMSRANNLVERTAGGWTNLQRNIQEQRVEPTNTWETVSGTIGAAGGGILGGITGGFPGAVAGGLAGQQAGVRLHQAGMNALGGRNERSINDLIDDFNRNHGGMEPEPESLPDLSDLIPENTDMDASGSRDTDVGEVTAARSSSAASGGNNPVSKETPISNYPSLSYGLQETHTTILPWTGWLTVALGKPLETAPVQLKLRMNTPYDFINSSTLTSPAINAAFTNNGLYVVPANENGVRVNSSRVFYPETITNTVNERPAWRDYWAALYDYYTVLGCEYKITMVNPVSKIGASWIIGTEFDTYSDTATSTGNVMPATKLSEALAYKNMKWTIVEYSRSEVSNKQSAVIAGTYKPGQARRNIVNDGDVKTWTKTGTTLPTLKEDLVLNFWKAPLGYYDYGGDLETATFSYAMNMQIEIKYIVQFKDLKLQARYPNTITTDQDITQILNENPDATGSALQKW